MSVSKATPVNKFQFSAEVWIYLSITRCSLGVHRTWRRTGNIAFFMGKNGRILFIGLHPRFTYAFMAWSLDTDLNFPGEDTDFDKYA